MRNFFKTFALLFLMLFTTFSCSEDPAVKVASMRRETSSGAEIISERNLTLLKEEALTKFRQQGLRRIFSPNFDIKRANDTLRHYQNSNIQMSDIRNILGTNWDNQYFDDLNAFFNLAVQIYHSPMFNPTVSLRERQDVVEEVLDYILESEIPIVAYGCGAGFNACVRNALRQHKIRMASVTAGATLGIATTWWTGAGAVASVGGWVIGMIASGASYQADYEMCVETYC